MIAPTRRAVLLAAAGLPLALAPVLLGESLWPLWLAGVTLSAALIGLDAVLSLRPDALAVECEPPEQLFIGDSETLRVALRAPKRLRLELLLDLDPLLVSQPATQVTLAPGTPTELSPLLRARRRGQVELRGLWLRWEGPLGLVRRVRHDLLGRWIPVLPNVRAVRVRAIELFSTRNLMSGLKVEHYLGDGSEFESLREFQPGFDSRAIDWKASARHNKLLVREFRAERNHQLVLAFDTGYLMREPLEGIPKLDHAINAGLLISYVALKTGDRVGMYGFDARAGAFIAPAGGVRAFHRLQRYTAGFEYSEGETNFTLGLSELAKRLRRRSLVVVISDFVDSVTAELMVENLQRLASPHLVLFVTLRDPGLEALRDARPGSVDDVARAVVAGDMLREREGVLLRLRRAGVHCIDAPPQGVSTDLINRYLEIKRREMV